MVKFWLDNFLDIFNIDNFKFDSKVKLLNVLSLLIIVVGLFFIFKHKNSKYFIYVVMSLSVVVLLNNITESTFKSNFSNFSNSDSPPYRTPDVTYSTKIQLIRDSPTNVNKLYVNNALNLNKGDIIQIADSTNGISENHVISNIFNNEKESVIVLLDNIKNSYQKDKVLVYKVSDSSPNILPPPNANRSIEQSIGSTGTTNNTSFSGFSELDNKSRHDWNLELSTYNDKGSTYEYQGQPYGPLKCRKSSPTNPMGTINVTEYSSSPVMYGTCNVGDLTTNSQGRVITNDQLMTDNFEEGVSMRVDDLLFHKGNSQSRFSPNAVDTLPDNQEAFAHFCYRSPTNLVNPKYASIFVNDPEKYKLVSKLAKATGTENGGGGR